MSKRSQSIAALAVAFSLLALGYALTRDRSPSTDPATSFDAATTSNGGHEEAPAPGSTPTLTSSELTHVVTPGTARARRPSRIIVGASEDPEREEVLARYAKRRAERDALEHGEPIEVYSEDPINRDVLGPGRWMAQPTDDTARALDAVIDASPAPEELARQARVNGAHRGARALASRVATDCVSLHRDALPRTSGRILIDLSVSARRGLATVEHASLTSIVDLDHPDLRGCLSSGLLGATFPASDLSDALDVRVPLFFRDGAASPTP